jgi:hypothetical protein
LLTRKRKEVAELKNVATQTSGSGRIDSDYGEPELGTGIIDGLLMEIKAGSFQCRWSL